MTITKRTMLDELKEILQVISAGGVAGILITFIVGLLKGWFVTGREYQRVININSDLLQKLASNHDDLNRLKDRVREMEQVVPQLREELRAMTSERDYWRTQAGGPSTPGM